MDICRAPFPGCRFPRQISYNVVNGPPPPTHPPTPEAAAEIPISRKDDTVSDFRGDAVGTVGCADRYL